MLCLICACGYVLLGVPTYELVKTGNLDHFRQVYSVEEVTASDSNVGENCGRTNKGCARQIFVTNLLLIWIFRY